MAPAALAWSGVAGSSLWVVARRTGRARAAVVAALGNELGALRPKSAEAWCLALEQRFGGVVS